MKVLIVEDNLDLSGLLKLMLDQHELIMFLEPVDVADEDIRQADAAIVDFMLPGMNGCNMLQRIARVNPNCRRVIWTASSDLAECEWAHVSLKKPGGLDKLEEAIRG